MPAMMVEDIDATPLYTHNDPHVLHGHPIPYIQPSLFQAEAHDSFVSFYVCVFSPCRTMLLCRLEEQTVWHVRGDKIGICEVKEAKSKARTK